MTTHGESTPEAVIAAPLRKPYVTPYSEEAKVPLPLVFDGPRLTYTDATPQDRMFGVLWARCGLAPGRQILWHMIHTLR
ncbi:hypothetical protein [Streptosporangium sp. NPDC000396]|uniref:hypothetical protein n=1 Tax=Streptosporangium sp. NPDC000396 TaxID=3366185 RepID=UPI003698C626